MMFCNVNAVNAETIIDSTQTFGYELIDTNSVRIVKYKGNESILTIPDTIDGYTVTEIDDETFMHNNKLEEVVIPDTMQYIGSKAFMMCKNIKKLTINGNNLILSNYAFSNCTNLEELIINNGVAEIGDNCFHGSTLDGEQKLKSVTIPGSVKTIGSNAFSLWKSLDNITLSNGVETIGVDAFALTNIKKLTIPDSVQNLSQLSIRSLESIDLGDGITTLGPSLFSSCFNLSEIKFPDSFDIPDNEVIAESGLYKTAWYTNQSGCIVVGHNLVAYRYNQTNKEAIIPDNVYYMNTDIGNLNDLDKIIVPTSVKELNCTLNATTVEINCPITTLKSGIIGRNVQKLTLPSTVTTLNSSAFSSSLTEVNMPDSITTICEGAFRGCRSLKSITIPPSVTRIESRTFYECNSLETIFIPESITYIGDYAFYDCDSLTEITIPETVTQMGTNCFYNCSGLLKVEFNAKEVPENCFAECDSLYSISFGPAVQKISKYAFFRCYGLINLTIPGNVKTIGEYAFSYCEKMISCELQEGITLFSKACFLNATSLKEVTVPNSTVSIDAGAFGLEYYIERGVAFNWEYAQNMLYEETGYRIVSGFKMNGSNDVASSYAKRNGINYTEISAEETSAVEKTSDSTTIKSEDGIPIIETKAENIKEAVQADTQNSVENEIGFSGVFVVIVILLILIIITLVILIIKMKKSSNKNT